MALELKPREITPVKRWIDMVEDQEALRAKDWRETTYNNDGKNS